MNNNIEFKAKVRNGAQLYKEGFKNKLIYLPKDIAKLFEQDEDIIVTVKKA